MSSDNTSPQDDSRDTRQSDSLDDTIDSLLPEPQSDPYHDNDATEPDPYDVVGSEDLTLPPATGHASNLTDDASTGEELEVDSAPAGHNPDHERNSEQAADAPRDVAESDPGAIALGATDDAQDPVIVSDPDGFETLSDAQTHEPLPPTDEDWSAIADAEDVHHSASDQAAVSQAEESPSWQAPGDDNEAINQESTFCAPTSTPDAGQDDRREDAAATGTRRSRFTAPKMPSVSMPSAHALGGFQERLFGWAQDPFARQVAWIGAGIVLLSLLLDSGATALIVAALLAPIILLHRLMDQVSAEDHSWPITIIFAIVGAIIGLPLAWLAARTVSHNWIPTGVMNFGAGGFSGSFGHGAGAAPFLVWLVNGLIVPVVMILAIAGLPLLLRMQLNTSITPARGMMYSAGIAAGLMVASVIIYFRPLFGTLAPRMSTSEWTLLILGMCALRPIIWITSGALIGLIVWTYMRDQDVNAITVPLVVALALPLLYSIIAVVIAPTGIWPQALLAIVTAIAVAWWFGRQRRTA